MSNGHVGKHRQTPNEAKRLTVDYSRWLETGETVSSISFAALPVTVPPLDISTSAIALNGLSAWGLVSGGLDDSDYVVTVTAGTSLGQTSEETIAVQIRS